MICCRVTQFKNVIMVQRYRISFSLYDVELYHPTSFSITKVIFSVIKYASLDLKPA